MKQSLLARTGSALTEALGQVLASLARLTVISLFAVTFLLQPSQIPTGSMEPTILVGDFVLVNKQVFADPGHWRWLLPYRDPRRDDIIVFHYPVHPPELLVKRVIGAPGDSLRLRHGQVLLNGAPKTEPFARYTPAEPNGFRDEFPNLQRADPGVQATWWIELRRSIHSGELPVPVGRYFAMGDNRNNSQDSRFWGFVSRDAIIGEPLLIYLSVERAPNNPRGHMRWERSLKVLR